MAIGLLALAFGTVSLLVSFANVSKAEPQRQEQKKIVYPYPTEIA